MSRVVRTPLAREDLGRIGRYVAREIGSRDIPSAWRRGT
jgi:hypothetical protein